MTSQKLNRFDRDTGQIHSIFHGSWHQRCLSHLLKTTKINSSAQRERTANDITGLLWLFDQGAPYFSRVHIYQILSSLHESHIGGLVRVTASKIDPISTWACWAGWPACFLKPLTDILLTHISIFWRHLYIQYISTDVLLVRFPVGSKPLTCLCQLWPVFAYLSNIDVKTWQEMAVGQCALPCTCVFCLCSPEPSTTAWRNAKFIRLACPHRLSHIFCRDLEWWAMGHYRPRCSDLSVCSPWEARFT